MRTNLILAGLLVIIGSFAYWFEYTKKPEQQKQEEASKKLIALEQENELEYVQIVDTAKNNKIDIRCLALCKLNDANANWEITSPIHFKADSGNLGSLVSSVGGARIEESLTLEGDVEEKLKDYGLSKDKREDKKLVFKFKKDKDAYTVYFGDTAAVGDNAYVYVIGPSEPNNRIRLIPGNIKNNLERNLSYWRDKRVFNFSSNEVSHFELTNPKNKIILNKQNGNWTIMPGQLPADQGTIDVFLTGLAFMHAQDYVSDNKAKDRSKFKITGQPKYQVSVTVVSGDKKEDKIDLSVFDVKEDKSNKLYAILSNKEFIIELDRTHADKFNKSLDSFRVKNLLTTTEKLSVRELAVQLNKNNFIFSKSATSEWSIKSGKIDSFDKSKVEYALDALSSIKLVEYFNSKPKDLSEESSWTLLSNDNKEIAKFIFYTSDKGDHYVKLASGEFAKLDRSQQLYLPSRVEDFQLKK